MSAPFEKVPLEASPAQLTELVGKLCDVALAYKGKPEGDRAARVAVALAERAAFPYAQVVNAA